jgi:hypothetical protein
LAATHQALALAFLFHRPQISVEPVESFLDHLGSGHIVARVVNNAALMRNVNLTAELDRFVAKKVKTGRYENASCGI